MPLPQEPSPPDLPVLRSEKALAMFRHDLITPINLILGYSEMLKESLQEMEASEEDRADLDKVRQAANRLLAMINDNLRPDGPSVTLAPGHTPAAGPGSSPDGRYANPEDDQATGALFLVVDDDETTRHLVTQILIRQGYRSRTAANGREALEMLRTGRYDMVLLDVMMPEMDGFELLAHLKEHPQLRHLPVIMISEFTEIERTARCIEMGAEDYLSKPFNSTLLLARIASSLEKKRLRDREQATLKTVLEDHEHLSGELREAGNYVRTLLPRRVQGEINIDWRYIPCAALGGDGFGYFPLDDDHLAVFLHDVGGQGMMAALHTTAILQVLSAQALPGVDHFKPTSVLAGLNHHFKSARHHNLTFSIWYGVYDRQTRRLVYASGGHPPAVLLHKDTTKVHWVERLSTGGSVLGKVPDIHFPSSSVEVPPGSRLYVFGDGAWKIPTGEDTHLSFEEFVEILAQPGPPTQSDLDRLSQRLLAAGAEHALQDDVAILQVEFGATRED